jgi:hypothetical protein
MDDDINMRSFMLYNSKNKSIHNAANNSIKNKSGDISLYFDVDNVRPIQSYFNYYYTDNNMRIFLPKNYTLNRVNTLITMVKEFGPNSIGYVIYADSILPEYLSYEDKEILTAYS